MWSRRTQTRLVAEGSLIAMANPGITINGRALRAVRFARRMTTTQLGEACGCTASFIRQMELNRRKPSIDMLGRLEQALGVTAEELDAELT